MKHSVVKTNYKRNISQCSCRVRGQDRMDILNISEIIFVNSP